MADVGEIFNRLADELANVSAVLAPMGFFKIFKLLKGTLKRLNLG